MIYLLPQALELLLLQPVLYLLPAKVSLLQGKLGKGVPVTGTVLTYHAQGASPAAGHATEALAAWKVVDDHLVELHGALPRPLGLLQDGRGCRGREAGRQCPAQQKYRRVFGLPLPAFVTMTTYIYCILFEVHHIDTARQKPRLLGLQLHSCCHCRYIRNH